MRRFGELLRARKIHLASVLTSETGKPIRQASGEIEAVGGRLDFFCENVEKALGEEVVLDGAAAGLIEKITYEPLGVVGNISAWNYPYFVGSNVFAPALLTGNAVMYKRGALVGVGDP